VALLGDLAFGSAFSVFFFFCIVDVLFLIYMVRSFSIYLFLEPASYWCWLLILGDVKMLLIIDRKQFYYMKFLNLSDCLMFQTKIGEISVQRHFISCNWSVESDCVWCVPVNHWWPASFYLGSFSSSCQTLQLNSAGWLKSNDSPLQMSSWALHVSLNYLTNSFNCSLPALLGLYNWH